MKAIKFLQEGNKSFTNGFQYPPVGIWTDDLRDIRPCVRGYHASATVKDSLPWMYHGTEAWEVELGGEIVEFDSKVVASRARLMRKLNWSKEHAIQFFADCAEHVLHIFEERYPNDDRPRKAIESARSDRSNAAAAAYAAYAAADAAAYAADDAYAAAYAADADAAAARYAADAAYAAAYAADAAAAAARYAADADVADADAAATAAAAAYDAYDAARAADAARYAAAYHDEREWQGNRLKEILYAFYN